MKTNLEYLKVDKIVKEIEKVKSDTILVVIDLNIWSLYKEKLNFEEKLKGKKVIVWKAPNGERLKCIEEYQSCFNFFLSKGVHRKAHLIAVGGGATSDFAGFVAATLLRGISWSIIPTTLLSIVDASIGGKVGINTPHGKNLIGAFHMPENIWIDFDFLETLPEAERLSGLGEVFKYAFLNREIFSEFKEEHPALEKIIHMCADFKERIVEEDFKESGKRKILNLGHTFGHGLERLYDISHGEAVVWGIYLILYLFGDRGLIEELKLFKQRVSWDALNPPWMHREFPALDLLNYVMKDKKTHNNDGVDLVLINSPGEVEVKYTTFDLIREKLEENKFDLRTISF